MSLSVICSLLSFPPLTLYKFYPTGTQRCLTSSHFKHSALLTPSFYLITIHSLSVLSQFNFLNTSFLYLLAALDLHRCVQAFSTFGEWRLLSSRRLLIVVTPWSTGSRARELQQLKLTGSAEVAHGLRCLAEGGVFPDQASSQCPRRWKADSELLTHQGSLVHVFSLCLVPFHLCLIVFLSPFPLLKD